MVGAAPSTHPGGGPKKYRPVSKGCGTVPDRAIDPPPTSSTAPRETSHLHIAVRFAFRPDQPAARAGSPSWPTSSAWLNGGRSTGSPWGGERAKAGRVADPFLPRAGDL